MLYFIGLGLGDEKDITISGKEALGRCEHVYLDAYTSLLPGVEHSKLEAFHGKKIELAHREVVEADDNIILHRAEVTDVAFLVVGDPFGATTHTDLVLRARNKNIPYRIIHNASIMNAIGCTGLQLYNFGLTVSIVMFTETWKPESWYDYIIKNQSLGLHTLCLLDIKMREQSLDDIMRGIPRYLPPRFMTVNQAAEQIIEVEQGRKNLDKDFKSCAPVLVGVARVGCQDQKIIVGTLDEIKEADFGAPLHSVVVPGKLHDLERCYLRAFAINQETFDAASESLV